MSKQNKPKSNHTAQAAHHQQSQKETLQTAESLLLMQELGRVTVNSQEIAQEIEEQAQFIQQMMRALQGK